MDTLRRLFGAAPTTGPRHMPPSLRAVLCGESGAAVWRRDPYDVAFITFRADGTGELQFALQTAVYIAAAFRWEEMPVSDAVETEADAAEPDADADADATSLGRATVAITLTTRRSADFAGVPRAQLRVNEDRLTAAAFQPRVCTVRLAQGAFALPRPGSARTRHAYHLQMTPSPFPPPAMWQPDADGGVAANRPWEWTTFVGGAPVE